MGYTLKIGNAKPVTDEYSFDWEVESARHDDAPAFGEPTDYTNARWPSYSAWADFCRDTGLYDMFLDKEEDYALIANHPGIAPINAGHLARVQAAIVQRKLATGDKPPGFWDYDKETNKEIDNGKDYQLVRLLWLEYWMKWALANCEHPAFQNS